MVSGALSTARSMIGSRFGPVFVSLFASCALHAGIALTLTRMSVDGRPPARTPLLVDLVTPAPSPLPAVRRLTPEPAARRPERTSAPPKTEPEPVNPLPQTVEDVKPVASRPLETSVAPASVEMATNEAAPGAPATHLTGRVQGGGGPAGAAVTDRHGEGPPRSSSSIAAPGSAGPAASATAGVGSAVTKAARPRGGYQVIPAYPAIARKLGVEGTALLKVLVLIDGRVGEVNVQQTAGHPDLDQSAVEAIRRWRFEPARRGTEPVAMWVLLPVEFRLDR